MTLTGPDVSHHNGTINPREIERAGHSFIGIKATQGVSYPWVDRWYRPTIFRIQTDTGLVPMPYHFLMAGPNGELRSPRGQADFFCDVVGNMRGKIPVLDVELMRNASGAIVSLPKIDSVRAFVGRFRERCPNVPTAIYTGRWYWKGHIGNPVGNDLGPLWHSAYASDPGALYGNWPSFTWWQYTDNATCPGIDGRCDMNRFNSDITVLRTLAGLQLPPVITKPKGEDMIFIFVGPDGSGLDHKICIQGHMIDVSSLDDKNTLIAEAREQGIPVMQDQCSAGQYAAYVRAFS